MRDQKPDEPEELITIKTMAAPAPLTAAATPAATAPGFYV